MWKTRIYTHVFFLCHNDTTSDIDVKIISVQELYQLFNHLQIGKKEHQLLPNINVNNNKKMWNLWRGVATEIGISIDWKFIDSRDFDYLKVNNLITNQNTFIVLRKASNTSPTVQFIQSFLVYCSHIQILNTFKCSLRD